MTEFDHSGHDVRVVDYNRIHFDGRDARTVECRTCDAVLAHWTYDGVQWEPQDDGSVSPRA